MEFRIMTSIRNREGKAMLPNEEFSPHNGYLENRDALKKFAEEMERVAVADV